MTILPSIVSTVEAQVRENLEKISSQTSYTRVRQAVAQPLTMGKSKFALRERVQS